MKNLHCILLSTITVLLILGNINLYSQSADWLWAKSLGGAAGANIAADKDGNTYVVGSFRSDSGTYGHSGDISLVKCDPQGNILWAKAVSGYNHSKIALDDFGNIYVSGNDDSYVADTAFIIKYNEKGNIIKTTPIRGRQAIISGLTTDKNGSWYVTGSFVGPDVTFDTITLNNPTQHFCMFIAKYDSNGTIEWAKLGRANNGISSAQGYDITTDSICNIYVLGEFSGSATFDTVSFNPATNRNLILLKYDINGKMLWAKSKHSLYGTRITTDRSGNIYLTGRFSSPSVTLGTITLTNNGYSDFVLVKYDANGNEVWATSAGGTKEDGGSICTTDSSGNVYVLGYYRSLSIDFGTIQLANKNNFGSTDLFIGKYDNNGNLLWTKSVKGCNSEYSYGIVTDNRENIYITGSSDSYEVDFGSKTIINAYPGSSNVIIAKIGSNLTSVAETNYKTELEIFPNPAKGSFHITGLEKGQWNIVIYNLNGNVVYQSASNKSQLHIDLSGTAKGTYFYRLHNESDIVKKGKIIVD